MPIPFLLQKTWLFCFQLVTERIFCNAKIKASFLSGRVLVTLVLIYLTCNSRNVCALHFPKEWFDNLQKNAWLYTVWFILTVQRIQPGICYYHFWGTMSKLCALWGIFSYIIWWTQIQHTLLWYIPYRNITSVFAKYQVFLRLYFSWQQTVLTGRRKGYKGKWFVPKRCASMNSRLRPSYTMYHWHFRRQCVKHSKVNNFVIVAEICKVS